MAEQEENKSFVEKVQAAPGGIRNYFSELVSEMRRVTWPSRKQVQATTTVVIITVFAFAAYFAVIDSLFTRLITKLFNVFTHSQI